MGPSPSKPSQLEFDNLVCQLEESCRDAAEALRTADVLLLCTGAGFSADSGLAVYKDIAGLRAYEELGLRYHDICRPDWLHSDPELFYGFWGTCYNDYRDTEPHDGYGMVRDWRDRFFASSLAARSIRARLDGKRRGKSVGSLEYGGSASSQSSPYKVGGTPGAFFIYTSNVDAHSFDFFDPWEVRECHGSTELWQCGLAKPCSNRIWRAPLNFRFAVDEERMRAPRDPGKVAQLAAATNGHVLPAAPSATMATPEAIAPTASPPQVPRATRLCARKTRAECIDEREAAHAAKRLKCVVEGLRLQMIKQQVLRRQRLDALQAKVQASLEGDGHSLLDAIFKALDCDGKQAMGFDEFCVLAELCNVAINRAELKRVFDDADKGGEGTLKPEQIATLFARFSLHVPGAPAVLVATEPEPNQTMDEARIAAGKVGKPFGLRRAPLMRLPGDTSKESDSSFQAGSNWPHCPHCGGHARPAIQMFCDVSWVNFAEQEERWWAWRRAVCSLAKSSYHCGRRLRVMILEIGCGSNVPTVRQVAEGAAAQFIQDEAEVTVVRVNPDYPLPDFLGRTSFAERVWHIGLPSRGLDVLRRIERHLGTRRRVHESAKTQQRRRERREVTECRSRSCSGSRSRDRRPTAGAEDESATAGKTKLRPDMQVRLHGLKTLQLNGVQGTCTKWDASKGRWHVRLPSGEVKRVKPENLQARSAKHFAKESNGAKRSSRARAVDKAEDVKEEEPKEAADPAGRASPTKAAAVKEKEAAEPAARASPPKAAARLKEEKEAVEPAARASPAKAAARLKEEKEAAQPVARVSPAKAAARLKEEEAAEPAEPVARASPARAAAVQERRSEANGKEDNDDKVETRGRRSTEHDEAVRVAAAAGRSPAGGEAAAAGEGTGCQEPRDAPPEPWPAAEADPIDRGWTAPSQELGYGLAGGALGGDPAAVLPRGIDQAEVDFHVAAAPAAEAPSVAELLESEALEELPPSAFAEAAQARAYIDTDTADEEMQELEPADLGEDLGRRYNLRARTRQQRLQPAAPSVTPVVPASASQSRRKPVALALQDSLELGRPNDGLLRRKRKAKEDESPAIEDSPSYSEEAPLHLQEAARRGAAVAGGGRGRKRGSARVAAAARRSEVAALAPSRGASRVAVMPLGRGASGRGGELAVGAAAGSAEGRGRGGVAAEGPSPQSGRGRLGKQRR